jgi:hypothetical protein
MAAASALLSAIEFRGVERIEAPPVFRAYCAIAMVVGFFFAGYGLNWDLQWHEFVGRENFFIPPHVLLYAGVALAGIAALLSILYESAFRSHDDGSIHFLWIFRGARGMFVAGFGILFIVIAAPLDDYWHRLYGLDVTLWSPFHLMGLFGSLMATIGIIYVLASLANATRETAPQYFGYTAYEWLIFLEFAALYSLTLILSQPALRLVPEIGSGAFAFYPAMLIWGFMLTLWTVAAVVYARTGDAAIAVLVVWLVRSAVFGLTVPLAVRQMAATLGVFYPNPGYVPVVALLGLLLLLALVPSALFVALAGRRGTLSVAGGALAGILFALGGGVWLLAALGVRVHSLYASALPALTQGASLEALPLTLVVAAIGGAVAMSLGHGFGKLLEAE